VVSGPTLIPRVDVDKISQRHERNVAKALMATLDEEWVIFHSYSWLRSHPGFKKSHLREGEADFVLLHRRWGLLILEVKGGDVEYDATNGLWVQNGHPMKDPFKQAQGNMHALLDQIANRCRFLRAQGKDLPCPFGYAVVFPACDFTGTLPPGVHSSVIFGASDLPKLGRSIEAALKHWATAPPQPMEIADFKMLREALTSNFRMVVSVSSRIDEDEEILLRLTEDQTEQLMGLFGTARAAIEGVAGSGKTLLALLRAEAFAQEGQQVLFLCYNKKLAESLSRRTSHVTNLTVTNFHRLCHDLCEEAGVPFEIPTEAGQANAFWSEQAPELLMEALDRLPSQRYDALVVDEAQDFKDLWWIAIEKLSRQPGAPLYIFYDRDQNLYGTELEFPITEPTFKLRTNCRNTRSIASRCSSIIGSTIRTSSFAPEGEEPLIVLTDSAEQVRQECSDLLARHIGQGGLSPSRVAILSTRSRVKSCLGDGKLDRYALTDELQEWENGKAVWFSTVKAFKGLEADVLVLIEANDFHPVYFSRQDLYVAASRAKHRLAVFTSSKEVAEALRSSTAAIP
jgi:hypothetical protein